MQLVSVLVASEFLFSCFLFIRRARAAASQLILICH